MENPVIRLCTNCEWMERRMIVGEGGHRLCNRPSGKTRFNLVEGVEDVRNYRTCEGERNPSLIARLFRADRCGPDALYFEQRRIKKPRM